MDNNNPPHTTGFKELAMQYYPSVTPESASKALSKWINGDNMLARQLQQAGYIQGVRSFTPKQVAIIWDFLGKP